MEKRFIHIDRQKQETLRNYAKTGSGLVAIFARFQSGSFGYYPQLLRDLNDYYGKPLTQLTKEEFFCPELLQAFETLAGKELARKLPRLVELRLEGQFSQSMWRRSYRSSHFAFYVEKIVLLLKNLIEQSCHEETLKEKLYIAEHWHTAYRYLLALEIREGNEEILSLLREAILGDNSQIPLTHEMIHAIIISGHEGLVEDLLKLLLAARLQEGLRQSILEAADVGSIQILTRILKLCIDQDLFRYSGTIRAFDVWTGMGYEDAKPAAIKKYARIAYDCLVSEETRQSYSQSDNNVEAYFALWAQGCYEIADTYKMVPQLLENPRHYRRVLGWLFVSQTDSPLYQMHMASAHLQERDEELLAWIVPNLAYTWQLRQTAWHTGRSTSGHRIPNPNLPDSKAERKEIFFQLKALAAFIGNKKRKFTGNPFDFVSVTLDVERVYDCMIGLAGYDMDRELVQELLTLAPNMNSDQRMSLICGFLRPETNPEHRHYLQNALNDRSVTVKALAAERLADCRLTAADLDALAQSLRSKSSDFRASIVEIFKKQPAELLRPLISSMLASPEENQNQAAIELIAECKEQQPDILSGNLPALQALRGKNISTQTQILLAPLLQEKAEEIAYTRENGFGLYDPQVIENYLTSLRAPVKKPGFLSRIFGTSELLNAKQFKAVLPSWDEVDKLMARMEKVYTHHADTEIEVEWYDGSRRKVLFGDDDYVPHFVLPADSGSRTLKDGNASLNMIPFWEEFREALGDYATDIRKMLGLYHVTVNVPSHTQYLSDNRYNSWFLPIAALELSPQYLDKAINKYRRRVFKFMDIFSHLPKLFDSHQVFEAAMLFYRSILGIFGEENMGIPYLKAEEDPAVQYYGRRIYPVALNHRALVTWRALIHQLDLNDEDFAQWFTLEYRLEQAAGSSGASCLNTKEYFRACGADIIPQDAMLAFLLDEKACMPEKIKVLTGSKRSAESRSIYADYPFAKELVDRVVHRAVDIEEKRGELATPMTQHCLAIERFEGARHFCNLLAALGKEDFFRGYEYSMNTTKKAVLSRLLKRCYPGAADTPESLAALLKATDISEKRLAEAVMYAPQWAAFAEKILSWPGLKCGVWFFHAHINESFSAEKETEVAIYSPISPQQFNDGAFDKNWFFEAYGQLGEKRFQILYKAAKYITSGSNQHRRSQLYADAALGKLDAQALMQEISEKRNQEKLRCYPLIPIAQGDSREALRRYEFIQRFLKESKQFGAQRRESEKKACATALENLAITTGLLDVNRLMWQMESQKITQIRPLMEPVILDGVSVRLTIDDRGDADISLEKDGKPLKTPPKSLTKNEYYLELKNTVKELKDLKRRCRESLEKAMTESTLFEARELQNICANPILAPMLQTLVWTDGENLGFLEQLNGSLGLRIAHPHDFKTAGRWAEFMHLLYEQKLVQPFKQVFREYYPLTEDERQEHTISRRYAGHQVQPQRTLALLKGRGWTVDYEEGLQKVFYKEDLIVRMFAMADWFSPGDIEAPTLETVEFFDRRTGENVALSDVPPILFSETMRDLDLVVSVAHVGGVDPEASHSTTEMRVAIATELAQLLGLSNVSWIGSHAKIHGSLGKYSVHMGSGIVHAEGVGMVAILPVHSQARGRIFLPFADDDPKTAEILSKILLLAEDKKIKDPAVLSQITA